MFALTVLLVGGAPSGDTWAQHPAGTQPPVGTSEQAGSAPAKVPLPPVELTAAKAYAALERNCAACHQTGRIEGDAPAGGLGDILALDRVSAAPWLVRRGLPDASAIYNVALTGERHLDVANDPAHPAPTADEVQALRDWISEMQPEPVGRCTPALSAAELAGYVVRHIEALPPETARLTRFLSIAHLANACIAPHDLGRAKAALAALGGAVRVPQGPSKPAAVPVDPLRLVWRIYLPAFGLSPVAWERRLGSSLGREGTPAISQAISPAIPTGPALPAIVLAATGSMHPLVPADWEAAGIEGPSLLFQAADGALSRLWRQPANLQRLSSEVWLPPDQAARRLAEAPAAVSLAARRILGGAAVPRPDIDRLAAFLATGTAVRPAAPAGTEAGGSAHAHLEIALSSDKTVYAAGDTARFSIEASQDCYLTLIGIDRAGRGTVLYPSEFEPANRLVAGKVLQVPAQEAPYRFRFKDKGRETIVAHCSTTEKSPPGLVHDYDRLRFTMLGDWQLFLREPPEMKEARRDDAATDSPRPQARQRRRSRAPEPKANPPAVPERNIQTRTAITIQIE